VNVSRNNSGEKLAWQGVLLSVQPRIRLTRSFDQRSHTYLGYTLNVLGTVGGKAREFLVAVGQGAHTKHQFQVGTALFGSALPVPDARLETADFYKVSQLKVGPPETVDEKAPPPWRGVPPPLEVYRERGHRRLAARTFDKKCCSCIWGCRMPVELIIDQWNPSRRRYRSETFCYGPLFCQLYQAGPVRTAPIRRPGMIYTEEDWNDPVPCIHAIGTSRLKPGERDQRVLALLRELATHPGLPDRRLLATLPKFFVNPAPVDEIRQQYRSGSHRLQIAF